MSTPPSSDSQSAAMQEAKSPRPYGASSSRDFENQLRRVMPAVNLFIAALALVSFMTADRVWDPNAELITCISVVCIVAACTIIVPPIMKTINRPLFQALDAESLAEQELFK